MQVSACKKTQFLKFKHMRNINKCFLITFPVILFLVQSCYFDPDALLERVEGWHFPVSGLRYWMLGLPSPQSASQILHWTEQGYPQVFEQDGWRIEIRDYTQVDTYTLPKKLFINRRNDEEEVDVRLVFSQWGLTDD